MNDRNDISFGIGHIVETNCKGLSINARTHNDSDRGTQTICNTGLVSCGECGEFFRRIHWNNRGCKSIVWRCITRLDKKGECGARTVNETALKSAFLAALNQMIADSESYLPILQDNIASVLLMSNPESAEAIQARIDTLQQQIVEKASHNQDYEDIAQEIFRLRDQKEKSFMNDTSRTEYLARINELEEFITSQPSEITEFDENLVKRLLAKVTVYEEKLVFEFKSGVNVEIEN